jgi:hypothetical protein
VTRAILVLLDLRVTPEPLVLLGLLVLLALLVPLDRRVTLVLTALTVKMAR